MYKYFKHKKLFKEVLQENIVCEGEVWQKSFLLSVQCQTKKKETWSKLAETKQKIQKSQYKVFLGIN